MSRGIDGKGKREMGVSWMRFWHFFICIYLTKDVRDVLGRNVACNRS